MTTQPVRRDLNGCNFISHPLPTDPLQLGQDEPRQLAILQDFQSFTKVLCVEQMEQNSCICRDLRIFEATLDYFPHTNQ